MKVQSKKGESIVLVSSEITGDLGNELKKEISYGLEYVIDEIISATAKPKTLDAQIDWFGLSDLTLE
jgi:hypothetical protein